MKTKTAQHKNVLLFILVIITGFSSTLSFFHVRQVGAPASDLSSERNPAIRGQAINVFSPPKASAAYNRRVLLYGHGMPCPYFSRQSAVTIIRVRRQPNPQVANNSGTHNEFLLSTRRPGGQTRPLFHK